MSKSDLKYPKVIFAIGIQSSTGATSSSFYVWSYTMQLMLEKLDKGSSEALT